MKISKKAQYALESLLYMAVNSDLAPHSISVVAKETGISHTYLEQIFFILRKNEILKTRRGLKGGFLFNVPLSDLTVGSIISIMENDVVIVPCVEDRTVCSCNLNDICVTRDLWCQIYNGVYGVLNDVTMANLVSDYNKQI